MVETTSSAHFFSCLDRNGRGQVQLSKRRAADFDLLGLEDIGYA
jgi:hypothetical protein